MRILRVVVLLLLSSGCVFAEPQDVAARRAHLLHRGVNASMWFAQSNDYSTARLRSYTTADDIALMHSLGFDHVRLSIDGGELMRGATPDGLNTVFLAELDRAIHTMLQDGCA